MAEQQKQQKQQKTKTVTGKKKNAFVANDFAKNIGTCAAIRATFNLGNFVGKGNSAKELAANTKIPNMEDVYEIACINLPEAAWKGKSVDAIFSYLAAKKTLDAYKEAEKKVVTQKGEEITDEAVLKNPAIMKDSSGKAYYQKYKREMFAEFESGIDAARTELMQGKPITDPYTKEKVDASKASKILNGVGKAVSAAGSQIGYILGLDKTNKDIYSKMLFSVIGGGSKLWAAAKKAAATAKAKNQEQGKEKPAEAKPAETAPEEQKKEAPAEEPNKEAPAEEPKKEPEGQANNPEGEEPQKPQQKAKPEHQKEADEIKKQIGALADKPNPDDCKAFSENVKKFITMAAEAVGKPVKNAKASIQQLRNAVKALHVESFTSRLKSETYFEMILAEDMIDMLEDEQPSPVPQNQQQQPSVRSEITALINEIKELIVIKDDKEFHARHDKWKREVANLIDKTIKAKELKKQLIYSTNPLDALCQLLGYIKQQKLNDSFDAEIADVANKFLNMLREKYK